MNISLTRAVIPSIPKDLGSTSTQLELRLVDPAIRSEESAAQLLIELILQAAALKAAPAEVKQLAAEVRDSRSETAILNLAEIFSDVFKGSPFYRLFSVYSKLPLSRLFCCSNNAFSTLELAQRCEVVVSCRLQRKREGRFYTPQPVVETMLTGILEQQESQSRLPTILDPACGSGIFLISSLQKVAAIRNKNASKNNWTQFISGFLHGVDRDPMAAEVCRYLISLECAGQFDLSWEQIAQLDFRNSILTGNSLIDPAELTKSDTVTAASFDPLSWKQSFPNVLADGGFDIIVGNPPYGISRDDKIPANEVAVLKRIYGDSKQGKINKYLSFMLRGYGYLKPGGVLSFIVPNSWLGIRSARAIRKKFLEDGAIEQVIVPGWRVFRGASVETVIVNLTKPASSRVSPGSEIVLKYWSRPENELETKASIKTANCLEDPEFKIPVAANQDLHNKLWKAIRRCSRLKDHPQHFRPMIALQAYATGKGTPPQTPSQVKDHVFHADNARDSSYYPYLEGSDIRRFALGWSGKYLSHGPWLAEPQRIERFCGPRIVLREIMAEPPYRVHATYLDQPYLYNKSVLHIIAGPNGVAEDLLALLGILNSKFGSELLYNTGHKTQRRVFPKYVNADLLNFPLPIGFFDLRTELSNCVNKLLKVCNSLKAGGETVHRLNRDKLNNQLDQVVAQAYRI